MTSFNLNNFLTPNTTTLCVGGGGSRALTYEFRGDTNIQPKACTLVFFRTSPLFSCEHEEKPCVDSWLRLDLQRQRGRSLGWGPGRPRAGYSGTFPLGPGMLNPGAI